MIAALCFRSNLQDELPIPAMQSVAFPPSKHAPVQNNTGEPPVEQTPSFPVFSES